MLFSCSSGTDSPEKKEILGQKENKKVNLPRKDKLLQKGNKFPSLLSYLQQKENIKNSAAMVLADVKLQREKSETTQEDLLSALKNIYFRNKLDHLYVTGKKKPKGNSLLIQLPGVNSKKPISLQLPYSNLQPLHSKDDRTLYRYRGKAKSFTVPKSNGASKNIDWVHWKLIDALFPVRLHKNKRSFLTGNSSQEFIVDNRFTYFFVSKDAIFAELSNDTLLLLLYAHKSKEQQSINFCWASLYIVDKQRKMKVLNMADINLGTEKQHRISEDGWLLRAQIAQIPRETQGIGFAIRSEISVQFDDFILLALNNK